MTYSNNEVLPEYVKKYSTKVKSQWRYVFNSTYTKVLKETKNKKEAEIRAFKSANSVLKKRMSKEKNSQNYINHMVDMWLSNLDG